jgi:hypothetical protein
MGSKARKKPKPSQPDKSKAFQSKQISNNTTLPLNSNRQRETLFVLFCLLITLVVYLPSLTNGFIVNWDDGGYIHQHELVHSITWHNFITISNHFL